MATAPPGRRRPSTISPCCRSDGAYFDAITNQGSITTMDVQRALTAAQLGEAVVKKALSEVM